MINADKYKKNKFRKLVPTSTSETDKLQQLTTIDHDQEPLRPHLIISQEIKRSTSKVGIERVSERYKEKHFVFERRLKTINSTNERGQQPFKQINSSVGQYRKDKEKHKVKSERKLQSLLSVIQDFRLKAQQISKAERIEQLGPVDRPHEAGNNEQTEVLFDEITNKAKLSSARLLSIYLNRQVIAIKKHILSELAGFCSLPEPQQNQKYQITDTFMLIKQEDSQQRQQRGNCRKNLLNVSKFFKST